MQLARGDEATARLHRQWLHNLQTVTGKPLTRIAKEIKVSPSTLTRPVSEGEHGTSTLHARTIAKIVAHTGVEPPKTIAGSITHRSPIGLGEDVIPFTPDEADPIAAAVAALIGTRNGIAAFVLRTRALELGGYIPGDVVLVDRNGTPQPGDVVMAEIHDWQRVGARLVLRVLERASPIDLLMPKSLDPNLSPIVVDNDRVAIKGVVLPHRLRSPEQ